MLGISSMMGGSTAPYLQMQRVQRNQPAAQNRPTAPVPPVPAAAPVRREGVPLPAVGTVMPEIRQGADPVEMAVRGRIQYPGNEAAQPGAPAEPAPASQPAEDPAAAQSAAPTKSARETMEEGECQTCKNRKYQDGSDDPGVSFKTPTTIAKGQAASAVRGHEQQHVVREQAKAQREDRKVVSQSVTMHTAICPECGDVYVSGGTTRTTTKGVSQPQPPQPDPKQQSAFDAVA